MKVRVERDTDPRLGKGAAQDFAIVGTAHADNGDEDRVPTGLGQQPGRRTRQALIGQQAFHTVSSGCTLSSRLCAAYASA